MSINDCRLPIAVGIGIGIGVVAALLPAAIAGSKLNKLLIMYRK